MVTKKILVFSILTLCLIGLVSAGMFDWITGKATSQTTGANVELGNTAPTIYYVEDVGDINGFPSSSTTVNFTFLVNDSDGWENINVSSASLVVNRSGETRSNLSCVSLGNIGDFTLNVSCNVDMWYFDIPGNWSINASIKDINGALATNTSQTFKYNLLTGFVMSPNNLNWTGLSVDSIDVPANNHPILMNNTGNSARDVNVTGINLPGVVDDTKIIYAENFTANNISASDGTGLVNATAIQISNVYLTRGNHSINDNVTGQEQIYFYLEALNSDLISQNYSTSESQSWEVSI